MEIKKPEDCKNINEAIIAIMGHVGYVQKQKSNELRYTYAGEAALIEAIRPWMVEYGVFMYVAGTFDVVRTPYQTKNGGNATNTTLRKLIRFVHAPSSTSIEVTAEGEGADSGDKSMNKASTGAYKYALRQTFCIETGDDPDKDPSEMYERRTARVADKAGDGEKKAPERVPPVNVNKTSKALVDFALEQGIGNGNRDAAKMEIGKILTELGLGAYDPAHYEKVMARLKEKAQVAEA